MFLQARLKSFDEAAGSLKLRPARLVGLRAVRLDRIVGSVGRARELGIDFMPQGARLGDRYQQILRLTRRGAWLPPISAYEVMGEYYVLDGHHRVAAAKETGAVYIDADVIQFVPEEDSPAKTLSQERARFELLTGVRDIELNAVGAYPRLLREIDEHKWFMSEDSGEDVGLKAAARDWYECIYAPVAVKLLIRGVTNSFPALTLAEIYLKLEDEKWLASEAEGQDIGFHEALSRFIERYGRHGLGRELERILDRVRADLLAAGKTLAEAIGEELDRLAIAPDVTDPYAAAAHQAEALQLAIPGVSMI